MNDDERRTLLHFIGLRQEETLLKWLFMPLWKTLTATSIFITFCFVFSGSFFTGILFSPIIVYGIYMSRKCHKRLREIKEFDLNLRYKP